MNLCSVLIIVSMLSCCFANLLSEQQCKYSSTDFESEPSKVGDEFLKALLERNALYKTRFHVIMHFHDSAWNYFRNVEKLMQVAPNVQRAFIRKRPADCAKVTVDLLLAMKDVVFTKECVDNIPIAVIDALQMEDLLEISKKSLALFNVARGKLDVYVTALTGVYNDFINTGNIPLNDFEFQNASSVGLFLNALRDKLMVDTFDEKVRFQAAFQIIGEAVFADKKFKIGNNSVHSDTFLSFELASVLRSFLIEFKKGYHGIDVDLMIDSLKTISFFSAMHAVIDNELCALIASKFLMNLVAKLSIGKSLLIPHFTLNNCCIAEFKSNQVGTILVDYFNVGAGMEYHPVKNVGDKSYSSHKISFMMPKSAYNLQFFNVFMRKQSIKEFYEGFFGNIPVEYLVKKFEAGDIFLDEQLFGSTATQSFFSWAETLYPAENFEYFRLALNSFIFDKIIGYEEMKNHKMGVVLMISMAEEIERQAEKCSKHTNLAEKLAEKATVKKKEFFALLRSLRIFPDISFDTLRIEERDFVNKTVLIDEALLDAAQLLNFIEVDGDLNLPLTSFAADIKRFASLLAGPYNSDYFVHFLLEHASSWNIKEGEGMPAKEEERFELMKNLKIIFDHVAKMTLNFDYDEKLLLLRLLAIQMWFALIAWEPKVEPFRPFLPPLTMSLAAHEKYQTLMEMTNKFSDSAKPVIISAILPLDGRVKDEKSSNLTDFCSIFFDEKSTASLSIMPTEMKNCKYRRSPLILSPFSSAMFYDTRDIAFHSFYGILSSIFVCQEMQVPKALCFGMVGSDHFRLKETSTELKLNVRHENPEIFAITGKDVDGKSVNSIIGSNIATADPIQSKIIKQAALLYCLSTVEIKQYSLIEFLSRRPNLFRRADVVNMLFQAINPMESGWQSNPNLIGAWMSTFKLLLTFHSIRCEANIKSVASMKAFQNTLVFAFSLIHLQTQEGAVRNDLATFMTSFVEKYDRLYEDFDAIIEPSYFYSFAAYLKMDFIHFASHYLAAHHHIVKGHELDLKFDIFRIFNNVFGVALKQFYQGITIDAMRNVAVETSKLTGICNNCGGFNGLVGSFPEYKDPNGCLINLMQRIFLPKKGALAFQPSFVKGLEENFCRFTDFFTAMGDDLKMTIQNANYEFVKTNSAEYRLTRVINGVNFILMDDAAKYFSKSFSSSLYSFWCSKQFCILYKHDSKTLKTELVAQYHAGNLIKVGKDQFSYEQNEKSVIYNYFPEPLVYRYATSSNDSVYHILQYLDSDGNQLRILERYGILYYGTDKKYSCQIKDLKRRLYPVYKLDSMGILVVSNSSGQMYAVLHLQNNELIKIYSDHASWITGHKTSSNKKSEILQKNDSFISSFLIPMDSTGFLLPNSRFEFILVAFYYLAAGEYEVALNYLKGVHHTNRFSMQEAKALIQIIQLNDNRPDAQSIRSYAAYVIMINIKLFDEDEASKFMESFIHRDQFRELCRSFHDRSAISSKNLRFFYDASDRLSILSEEESKLFKEWTADVLNRERKSLHSSEPYDEAGDKMEIIDEEDVPLMMESVYYPLVAQPADAHSLSDIFHYGFDPSFCDNFKFLFKNVSLPLRRSLHTLCFKNINGTDLKMDYPEIYEFDFIDNAHVIIKEHKYYNYVPPRDWEDRISCNEAESLLSMESKLFNGFDKISNMLNDFNFLLDLQDARVVSDCSTKTDYVDKNVCEGEADLQRKELRRAALKDLILSDKFVEASKEIPQLINHFKNEIRTLRMVLESSYVGHASNLIDFHDESPFFDRLLMRIVRYSCKQLFSTLFPSTQAEIMLDSIHMYFAYHVQVQRFERIVEMTAERKESVLMDLADNLIVELSHRPTVPFKVEYLMFEKVQNFRLRNENIKALQELFYMKPDGSMSNSVIQRVMGGGKTLVIGSFCIAFGEDGKFSILIVPSSLLETNAANMLSANFASFSQQGHVLFINRCYAKSNANPYEHCIQRYSTILSILKTCLHRREYIMVSRESLLSLYNSYKESLIKGIVEVTGALLPIIDILKRNGFAVLDEVDSLLYPYFELNYPIRDSDPINEDLGRSIISAFKVLVRSEEIRVIFDVKERHPPPLSHDDFDRVLVILKRELLNDPHYQKCNGDPSCKSQFDRFLSVTLEDCLNGLLNVSYGKMKQVHDLDALQNNSAVTHARPYVGANRESKQSEFSDPITALTFTMLSYIRQGLSGAQKMFFFESAMKDAESELSFEISKALYETTVSDKRIESGLDKTVLGALFSSYCNFSNVFSAYAQLKTLQQKKAFLSSKCFMKKKSLGFVFSYIEKFVLPTITKTDEQVSSNAQNLFHIFKRFVAYSGTIDNTKVFDAEVHIKTDDIALGTIMSRVLSKNTSVLAIKSNASISEIFDEIEVKLPGAKSKIRAFIDVAAIFNEDSNKQLVSQSTKILGLAGGLYFKTGTDNLYFSNADGKEILMRKTDGQSLQAATKCKPSERFTFYDEVHTRGVDIVQSPDAIALVTVRSTTTLSNLLQGILRMRNIFGNQQIIFLVPQDQVDSIKSPGPLVALDILRSAYRMKTKTAANENQMILLQKMSAFVDDKIILAREDRFYANLILTHQSELEMMKLSFAEKLNKYFSFIKPFTDHHNAHLVWLTKLKDQWLADIAADEHAKGAMTRNVQKQAQNQKEAERLVEVLNQVDHVVLQGDLHFHPAYAALQWKSKDLFAKIENVEINDFSRTEPLLISNQAIVNRIPCTLPPFFFMTSNFVQVLTTAGKANVSFKLDADNSYARRDQFTFFIGIFKVNETDFQVVLFDQEEIVEWLQYWRDHDDGTGEVIVASSNGDIVYPKRNGRLNIFEMFHRKDNSLFPNIESLVRSIALAFYSTGMLEIFSNFFLASELWNFDENAYKRNPFNIEAFFQVDPEVEQMSILREVSACMKPNDQKIPLAYRHMNCPGAPIMKFEIVAIEEIDVDSRVFVDSKYEAEEFYDSVSEDGEEKQVEFVGPVDNEDVEISIDTSVVAVKTSVENSIGGSTKTDVENQAINNIQTNVENQTIEGDVVVDTVNTSTKPIDSLLTKEQLNPEQQLNAEQLNAEQLKAEQQLNAEKLNAEQQLNAGRLNENSNAEESPNTPAATDASQQKTKNSALIVACNSILMILLLILVF